MGVYSKDDLFTLWLNFRGQSNELQMMSDFALCDKAEAQAIVDEFETRLEVETLDGDHRGKEYPRWSTASPPSPQPKKATKAAPPNPKYQPFRDRFPGVVRFIGQQSRPPAGLPAPP